MNFILLIIFNIFIQYFVILLSKGVLSYNEELFLYIVYTSLFILILNLTPKAIKTYIIMESFNIIIFFEKFYYLKITLIARLKSYYIFLRKKQLYKYLIYIIYSKFALVLFLKKKLTKTKKLIMLLETFKLLGKKLEGGLIEKK